MIKHELNAQGKSLGRVASEAAHLLMGKSESLYERHRNADVQVRIVNARKLHMSGQKRQSKLYISYSGYPGGLKARTLEQVVHRHGYREVLRRAVYGMLPANKLRPRSMERLIVEE